MFHSQKIKKMTALNNLLSRVKNIFSRKATTAASTPLEAEPPTGIASVRDPRLSAAFADIEKYLADNYGTPTTKLRYQDYTNGATLISEDATFSLSLAILTEPDGLYNLPDNVLLLVAVTSTNDTDWLTEKLGKLIVFLRELGTTHHIQHLALAFSKDKLDHPATVHSADVTCVRLY